jgi:hypothetical protein
MRLKFGRVPRADIVDREAGTRGFLNTAQRLIGINPHIEANGLFREEQNVSTDQQGKPDLLA